MVLDIKPLKSQQENGLNTALPLAYNQLAIKRTLTTESASIFMPFVNQELQDRNGGMYYGNNAVSHNLIMMNRRNCKNGNGFIFGTPGSGKSMSAKQEMMTVLLSSPDTVVVIDPEGEYYPMAEMLGDETGEVIRIAAGSDVHINPFDIDMDADSKDDPMAIKSDFIVSLCRPPSPANTAWRPPSAPSSTAASARYMSRTWLPATPRPANTTRTRSLL